MNKRKIGEWAEKHINLENVKIAILFIPILYVLIKTFSFDDFELKDYLNISIIISFVFLSLCDLIAKKILSLIERKTEDSLKLTDDVDKVIEIYGREKILEYRETKFPVVISAFRKINDKSFNIIIDHSEFANAYSLPKQISDYSDYLMRAHKHSVTINKQTIRINSIKQVESDIHITYSRTSYFDTLITNRAMDYTLPNGKTIRDIYEPGPFLSELQSSKLSNHLGFNGFIELSDGKFIFVKRSNLVSVAKGTFQNAISASYKAVNGVNDDRKMTIENISKAIKAEIKDELKIDIPPDQHLENCIFAFYRDLIEGGKPHFLFYYKVNYLDSKGFESMFNSAIESEKKIYKEDVKIDGLEFEFFTLNEMKKFKLLTNGFIVPSGKKYKMSVSYVAALAMFLQALE